MMRHAAGKQTALPFGVLVHMVAARYGQTPEQVRDWPMDDFTDAVHYMGVTGDGRG